MCNISVYGKPWNAHIFFDQIGTARNKNASRTKKIRGYGVATLYDVVNPIVNLLFEDSENVNITHLFIAILDVMALEWDIKNLIFEFFPNSISLGSSAIVKVPEQVGASSQIHTTQGLGTGFPGRVSFSKRIPRSSQICTAQGWEPGSQEELPKQGFQARFPGRFPSKVQPLRTLAWEPVPGNLAWNLLGTLPGNLFLKTFLLVTSSGESGLGTSCWEPLPGNLFLVTLPEVFLGTLLGNLAWEPCLGTLLGKPVPGNLASEPLAGNPCLGTCSWEPLGPGRGSQARFSGRGSQARVPRKRFPGTGSQARFPGTGFASTDFRNRFFKVSRNRFPSKISRKAKQGSQNRFSSKCFQKEVSRKRRPSKVPSKFPKQDPSKKRLPEQVFKQVFSGRGFQEEVSKQGSQCKLVPKQCFQEEVPKRGSQPQVPTNRCPYKVPKNRFASKVPKHIPKQGSQEQVPKQVSQEQVHK